MLRFFCLVLVLAPVTSLAAERKTEVTIVGDAFHINGQPTYESPSIFFP